MNQDPCMNLSKNAWFFWLSHFRVSQTLIDKFGPANLIVLGGKALWEKVINLISTQHKYQVSPGCARYMFIVIIMILFYNCLTHWFKICERYSSIFQIRKMKLIMLQQYFQWGPYYLEIRPYQELWEGGYFHWISSKL